MRTEYVKSLPLLLTLSMLACMLVGCGTVPREKLVEIAGYGRVLASEIAANETLPDSLFEQQVITAGVRDFLNEHIKASKALAASFNAGLAEVLKQDKPQVGALASLAADLVEQVRQLRTVANPAWQKALAVAEISLRGIAAYFAAHVSALVREGVSRDRIARACGVQVERLIVVEDYAAGR